MHSLEFTERTSQAPVWPKSLNDPHFSQVLKTLNFRPGVEGGLAGVDGEAGANIGAGAQVSASSCDAVNEQTSS